MLPELYLHGLAKSSPAKEERSILRNYPQAGAIPPIATSHIAEIIMP